MNKRYIRIPAGVLAAFLVLTMSVETAAAKTVTFKADSVSSSKSKISASNAKAPSINVTRSTTDDSGAVVGINVSSTKGEESDSKPAEKVNVTTENISGSVAGIPYNKLAMANVEEAVNVRADASESATLLGKLYSGCGGEILDQKGTWTKIKTGNLTGWVRNDYLLFGEKAKKLADASVTKTATSIADTLRVRKEPSENAGIYSLLARGDEIAAVEELGEWVSVEYADGTLAYVSAQYVTISDELGKGETLEEISARELAEKKEKEAAAAETEAGSKETSGGSQMPSPTNNGAIAGDINDVQLLAALIQCEAGYECYEGQVSVGTVVMNRLRSGRYGNSIYSVIYAKSQFSPAGSGMVAKVYAQGPKESCVKAAQEAMSGVSYVGNATKFRNIRSGYTGIVIGNHVFW
ncbi:MAG: SH3 domain-containing protein [Lachnospiraceae bacterium]|nr:SH3 domain-containing protein [Lachnospiraceae bacterium]